MKNTVEMKITFPEVAGGRLVSTEVSDNYILARFVIEGNEESTFSSFPNNNLRDRIDSMPLVGEWMKHTPVTHNPKDFLDLYQEAGGQLTSIAVGDNFILAKFEIGKMGDTIEASSTISSNGVEYRIEPETFEEDLLKNTPVMLNQKETMDEYGSI